MVSVVLPEPPSLQLDATRTSPMRQCAANHVLMLRWIVFTIPSSQNAPSDRGHDNPEARTNGCRKLTKRTSNFTELLLKIGRPTWRVFSNRKMSTQKARGLS